MALQCCNVPDVRIPGGSAVSAKAQVGTTPAFKKKAAGVWDSRLFTLLDMTRINAEKRKFKEDLSPWQIVVQYSHLTNSACRKKWQDSAMITAVRVHSAF